MRTTIIIGGLCWMAQVAAVAHAQTVTTPAPSPDMARTAPIYAPFSNLRWERIMPALGAGSPEITILHVDPTTHATQLMIRVPAGFHVAKHWHTANETHTIVSGTFIMEHDGERVALGPGSFNYMPSHMVHEAWTKPTEGVLLFITVDGAWDVNWVEGPPATPAHQ